MEVVIKEITPMNVVSIRHIGPYNEIGKAFDRLIKWAEPQGLMKPDAKIIGVYYDDPQDTPPDQLKSDACIVVTGKIKTEREIFAQTVGGGMYAVTTHIGPYDKIIDTWNQFYGEWLPKNGKDYRPDPCFEVYLNSPENTPPDELITELYLPIKS